MRTLGRILAVARIRAAEAARGPLTGFLVLFLALALAAVLLTPGPAGSERQRALDGFVLDAALLVSALAAAAFGAAALADDRDGGRDSLIAATPLRGGELFAGGLLGHAAALAILAIGSFAGFVALTGILAGGDRDRTPTRTPIRAERLLDGRGEPAAGIVVLTPDAPEATFLLPAGRATIERSAAGENGVRAWVDLVEYMDPARGLPDTYDVTVRIGDGPVRRIPVRRGSPLTFTIRPGDVGPSAGTPVRIRRVDPAMSIGLAPGGLLVEGPVRSFLANVAAAGVAWFLGLAVVAAAAAALSAIVGAPVAVTGAIAFLLVGRSLTTLTEAAFYLERGGSAPDFLPAALRAVADFWPDFDAYDLTRLVTSRWAVPAGDVLGLVPGALLSTGVLLGIGWALYAIRRGR